MIPAHAALSLSFAAVTVPIFLLLPTVVFYLEPALVKRSMGTLRGLFVFGLLDLGLATWFVVRWAWDEATPESLLLLLGTTILFTGFAVLAYGLFGMLIEHSIDKLYERARAGRL